MMTRRRPTPFPLLMAELAVSSWEVMARRGWLMALGHCSAAEYQRMVLEKLRAAQLSALALTPTAMPRAQALLAPWHRAAQRNAKRLRRRQGNHR